MAYRAGVPLKSCNARHQLAQIDPGFAPMAKDFIGMQVNGINANPDIPVASGPGRSPERTQSLD